MPVAIQADRLTKDYGAGRGLFELDLEVAKGEVFGFLGPNGAGKTTTIRLLMGMIRPSGGRATVFGLDCRRQSVDVKRLAGYVPGELPEFGALRGSEIVRYIAGLRGGVDGVAVKRICDRFDLDLRMRFRQYSRGNKQKLAIVLAFMHTPRLLILDEPTGGLDPLNQQAFYELCAEARSSGATIFLSSHVLSEVEHISDRIGIIRAGRLIRVAALHDLHEMHVRHVELEFAGTPPLERLRGVPGVEDLQATERTVRCTVRGGFAPFLQALAGMQVANLTSHEPSLEEVFLAYYRDDEHAEAG
jgi:ABC-2 type transport system ATP-binding protein